MVLRFFSSLFLSLSFAASAFAAEPPNTLTTDEKAAGWKLLFDGATTTGWRAVDKETFPDLSWAVVDGTLKRTGEDKVKRDIVTIEEFENFELEWDWKIAVAGNSGVKYNLVGNLIALGCEFQLLDDAKHPDGISGGPTHQAGALYDLIAPAEGKQLNPPGEWNHCRLLVSGNHVEQWMNGKKLVEFELGSEALKTLVAKSKYQGAVGFGEKTKSPILLQDHGDEVAFRSLKIRVLK